MQPITFTVNEIHKNVFKYRVGWDIFYSIVLRYIVLVIVRGNFSSILNIFDARNPNLMTFFLF